MSKRKSNSSVDETDREFYEHITALGLSAVTEYREWCIRHGFSTKTKKSWKLRCRERFLHNEAAANQRLSQKKREKKSYVNVIRGICSGDMTESDVTLPHLKKLCQLINPRERPTFERRVNGEKLAELLMHLHACRAKLFDGSPVIGALGRRRGNTFLEALALLAIYHNCWCRPIEAWKPRSHNSMRQFSSLLQHLLAEYNDVPQFFHPVWFTGQSEAAAEQRRWYLHVARGQNIRHCLPPVPYTKRMAHHFMRSPNDVTIEQAIRWGQVLGLGGDEQLARAIMATRLGESFEHEEFWLTVIRWFISHPMLDRAHVGPIIDYLQDQRFRITRYFTNAGMFEEEVAPQPNLSMKGRNPESLLRQVHAWHNQLARYQPQDGDWKSTGIDGFEFIEGSAENSNPKLWTIRELLSSRALASEGAKMKHCVASYASSCSHGYCSIWSLQVESTEGIKKAVTIEVRNQANLICQVRGKSNRLPTEKERKIIQRWADVAGLRVANYV